MVDEVLAMEEVSTLRVVGTLERVRPSGWRTMIDRIARAARSIRAQQDGISAVDRAVRFIRSQEPLDLKVERAMLMLRSKGLESQINRAVRRNEEENGVSGLFARVINSEAENVTMKLSGSYAIGRRTILDTHVEGTSEDLVELRLRLVHSPSIQLGELDNARISVTTITNIHSKHRITLESMMGSEDDRHSLSNVISTDLSTRPSWGVASSHKLGKELTLFSRYSSDQYSGRRVIVQAVKRCGRNTISPILSVASKGRVQAGITWKSTSSKEGRADDFLQLKALCSQNGAYSVLVKAQFGIQA